MAMAMAMAMTIRSSSRFMSSRMFSSCRSTEAMRRATAKLEELGQGKIKDQTEAMWREIAGLEKMVQQDKVMDQTIAAVGRLGEGLIDSTIRANNVDKTLLAIVQGLEPMHRNMAAMECKLANVEKELEPMRNAIKAMEKNIIDLQKKSSFESVEDSKVEEDREEEVDKEDDVASDTEDGGKATSKVTGDERLAEMNIRRSIQEIRLLLEHEQLAQRKQIEARLKEIEVLLKLDNSEHMKSQTLVEEQNKLLLHMKEVGEADAQSSFVKGFLTSACISAIAYFFGVPFL